MPELKIYCRHALTGEGWKDHVLLEAGEFGIISHLGQGTAEDAEICLSGPVIPGMPNLHSHGFQRLIAGLTGARDQAGDSFWGWREAMYRLANRITADQLEDCMAWVFAEMLMTGYTSCAEFHYLHHQPDGRPYTQPAEIGLRVLSAAVSSGMALTLLPVFYNVSGFDADTAGKGQRRFANSLDRFLELYQSCRDAIRENGLHRLGIAPHSLRAVPAGLLNSLLDAVADDNVPVHIHIAEQQAELEACLEFHGARPVEWLLDNAPVDERWCLVHATHMNDSERRSAAQSGAVAGLCPTTEADLGDGYFETAAWMNIGGQMGIGSDSNLRVSVAEELRLLEFSERLKYQQRNILQDDKRSCGRFLYEQAARGGAQALGHQTGSISVGCRADLLELDGTHPQIDGRSGDPVLDSFIFAGGREMVRSVFVGGEQVVRDGFHVDHDALKRRYLKVTRELNSP